MWSFRIFIKRFSECFVVLSVFFIFFLFIYFQTQQHKFVNWQCDMEYRGEDFTSAVTLGNPDVLVGSGMIKISLISYPLFIEEKVTLKLKSLFQERPRQNCSRSCNKKSKKCAAKWNIKILFLIMNMKPDAFSSINKGPKGRFFFFFNSKIINWASLGLSCFRVSIKHFPDVLSEPQLMWLNFSSLLSWIVWCLRSKAST